jgi:hypothetical protein
MIDPLKSLDKLWDKIEKSKLSRKRKDFLLTTVVLSSEFLILSIPVVILYLREVPDLVKWLLKQLGLI